jgi:glycosyltransferase involved in cell wall biosynthesis
MRRALVIDPGLNSPGGGTCVAAHALAALRRDFEVTLLSWHPVDFAPVNAAFGTDLAQSDFRLVRVPDWWRHGLRLSPLPLTLVMGSLLQRRARALLGRECFDLVVSTTNEVDVGVRAVQYVHYPWAYYPRPDSDYRWYHARPLVRLYRAVAICIGGATDAGIARNLTLVNSAWTARRFRDWYGGDAQVLHPPVPVDRSPLPLSERADTFACIGRMSPEKDVLGVIDILAEVRRRGHPVSLAICGQRQVRAYERQVLEAVAARRDWISIAFELPRAQLLEQVARCRFGIHGMVGEHFGIAVAEMVRLGCVCLAHADGGPAEILGGDASLLYTSPADAVTKICHLLEDPDVLARARAGLEKQASLFSVERFSDEFRRVCLEFATAPD